MSVRVTDQIGRRPRTAINFEPTAPFLLDQYPGAAAAYSLRKLRSGYTGPCVRVRRSSDNAETDIGFSGGALDTSALSAFIGSSAGYIVHKDDQQTGNAIQAVQSTASAQPKMTGVSGYIFNPGSKDKPAAEFDQGRHLTLDAAPPGDLKSVIFWVYLKSEVLQEGVTRVLMANKNDPLPFVAFGSCTSGFTSETLSIVDGGNKTGRYIKDPLTSGWHHIGMTVDGNGKYIFVVDGEQKDTFSGDSNGDRGVISNYQWDIGYRSNNSDIALQGYIHTTALFSKALSVSDIQSHYNRTK